MTDFTSEASHRRQRHPPGGGSDEKASAPLGYDANPLAVGPRVLNDGGLADVEVHGLEGPGGMPLEVERTHDVELRAAAMLIARRFSDVPGIRDLSQHLLGIGRRR